MANPRLYFEIANSTATPSASAVGARQQYTIPGGLYLPSGKCIYVTTSATSGWHVIAEGYHYGS